MKLAVHDGKGWNQIWREYCLKENIEFLEVNCFDTDIIKTLKYNKISHLMWHFSHNVGKDILMARNVLYTASKMGLKIFPDFDTCWHFDDKISQKYLLEGFNAPMVPSYAFYSKQEANIWLNKRTSYPIVAKLRRGAGSYNVILLNNIDEAKRYTSKMFGKGIHPTPGYMADVKNKFKVSRNWSGLKNKLKKAPNFFNMVYQGKKDFPKEKGYVYFQDFIPNNNYDLRIAIVGDYIWGFKRIVRSGDFRASGSGMIQYDNLNIPKKLIKCLHLLTKKISAQSIAYDLVVDKNNNFLIVEISYGFSGDAIYHSKGYWNKNYEFINENLYPEHIILKEFIK